MRKTFSVAPLSALLSLGPDSQALAQTPPAGPAPTAQTSQARNNNDFPWGLLGLLGLGGLAGLRRRDQVEHRGERPSTGTSSRTS